MTKHEILKQYFGYDSFRTGQEELIDGILHGKDVLGIMPTGAGKSLCFQIPSLMQNGLTIVISPLISLMKDQVNALTQSGIAAAFIDSTLTESEMFIILQEARNNVYKLIYVAPERLLTPSFLNFAQSVNISMVTVDEAHCISQWGHDFRPSYSKIAEFIEKIMPHRPVISAFTATATPKVREDIANLLQLKSPVTIVTGFDRPNLYFEVQKHRNEEYKFDALLNFLRDRKSKCGIIYCISRALVEEICGALREHGYNASRYHAGLPDSERRNNQEDFIFDRAQIMVATNAFGMGIDKSNVSFVVHYNMPKDTESYYQEAGRAGRDGEPADCLLLYNGKDISTNTWLIENSRDIGETKGGTSPQQIEFALENARAKLREMTFYCTTKDCLRARLLKYFGEIASPYCGNCSSCNTNFETVDVTIITQKILSCVGRMNQRFGIKMIVDVLRGNKEKRLLELGLNQLSTYGICADDSVGRIRDVINHLILSDYLVKTDGEYPIIRFGSRAGEVLRGNSTVKMKLAREEKREDRFGLTPRQRPLKKSTLERNTNVKPLDRRLLDVLHKLRMTISEEQKVPAFTIFSDSTLTDMCMKSPTTIDEFLDVSGVGNIKAERYGERFLSVIADFRKNNDLQADSNESLDFNTANIDITDEAVMVSVIADRINCELMRSGYGIINGQKINDWLMSNGYLELTVVDGANFKIPTQSGEELGIINRGRQEQGEPDKVNLYSREAQAFVIEASREICGI